MTKYEIDTSSYRHDYVALWRKLLKQAGYKITESDEDFIIYVETDNDNDWVLETLFAYEDGFFGEATECVE